MLSSTLARRFHAVVRIVTKAQIPREMKISQLGRNEVPSRHPSSVFPVSGPAPTPPPPSSAPPGPAPRSSESRKENFPQRYEPRPSFHNSVHVKSQLLWICCGSCICCCSCLSWRTRSRLPLMLMLFLVIVGFVGCGVRWRDVACAYVVPILLLLLWVVTRAHVMLLLLMVVCTRFDCCCCSLL